MTPCGLKPFYDNGSVTHLYFLPPGTTTTGMENPSHLTHAPASKMLWVCCDETYGTGAPSLKILQSLKLFNGTLIPDFFFGGFAAR